MEQNMYINEIYKLINSKIVDKDIENIHILAISFLNKIHNHILEKTFYQVQGFNKIPIPCIGLVVHDGLKNIYDRNLIMIDYREIAIKFKQINKSKIKIDIATIFAKIISPKLIYKRYTGESDSYWLQFVKTFNNVIFEYQTKEIDQMTLANAPQESIENEKKYGKEIRQKSLAIVGVTPEITKYQVKLAGLPKKKSFTSSNGIHVNNVKISEEEKDTESVNCLISANFRKWHGIDRIIEGLEKVKNKPPIIFHLVGESHVLNILIESINHKKLNAHFRIYGHLHHQAIDRIANFCDIGVGSLGLHRISLKQASILKNREYCARGLPFVYSFEDCDFPENLEFTLQAPADDSPIDINKIYSFACKFKCNKNIKTSMREYATAHLDWDVKIKKLNKFLENIITNIPDQNTEFKKINQNNLNKLDIDHYRYTSFAMQKLLTEAGFEDIQNEALRGWNASLAQMIGLWLKRAPMSEAARKQATTDLFPFYEQLTKTDVKPTDFNKNPMITGLSGLARAARGDQAQFPEHNLTKTVVVTDQFPILSQTFILDQITGLIDRGLGVEHWSLQRMDEPVVHENVSKYGLLDATRYVSLPPDSLRANPKRWTEQFLSANGLSSLDDVAAVQIHFGPNFNKLEPLFAAYPDLFVLVSFHGYDGSATFKVKGAGVYAGLFARANQITTPSQHMKNNLIQYGCPPDKIVVHHYGKDTTTFAPAPRPENRPVRLLSVARFVEKKGLEYSLRAFAKAQAGFDVEYRIVGYGPLEQEFKTLVKSLGMTGQVRFLGQLTNDAVRQEMATADIFVLTSVTASNGDEEGVPVSLIEAHALGLPVVSSRHAGIPELVAHGETGFLAEERDVEEIAGFMRVMIKNPAIRKAFSASARERVLREFDLAKLNNTLAERLLRRGAVPDQTEQVVRQEDAVSAPGEAPHPAAVYCPICRTEHDHFRPFGKPPRPNAKCPNCTSLERHRAIWLFLERHTDFFASPRLRMLHFAPETCLEPRFRLLMGKGYVTADLLNPRADVQADITNLQFPDASFDAVLCSHVLEHVPDDNKAMRELYRVLGKDGIALVMVPLSGAVTQEDLSITDPKERTKRYGQSDHVRYYGMDIADRLQKAGFAVQCINSTAICSPHDFANMRLSNEQIFLCRKQSRAKIADTDETATARDTTEAPPKTTAQALSVTARHWSTSKTAPRTRWWMHPAILRHINTLVCGNLVDGPWAGLERRMRRLTNGDSFARGVSIGCGSASKELRLLQEGIVGHFDLFEISPERVALGQTSATRHGVAERASFYVRDAFAQDLATSTTLCTGTTPSITCSTCIRPCSGTENGCGPAAG